MYTLDHIIACVGAVLWIIYAVHTGEARDADKTAAAPAAMCSPADDAAGTRPTRE